jgi:hypothetical protein
VLTISAEIGPQDRLVSTQTPGECQNGLSSSARSAIATPARRLAAPTFLLCACMQLSDA